MKFCFLCLVALLCFARNLSAQHVYTINADSVRLTGCDSSELIIENHTQNVNGFLFNTGRGRTIFKKGLMKLSDSSYLIGGDTLKYNAWVQGGNKFGVTGMLGTMDSNHLDLYANKVQRIRLNRTGKVLIGTTTDNGRDLLQVNGSVNATYFTNFTTSSGVNSGALRLRWGGADGIYIGFYKQGDNNRRGYFGAPADNRPIYFEDSLGISFNHTPKITIGNEIALNDARLSIFNPLGSTLDAFSVGRMAADSSTVKDFQILKTGNIMVGGGVNQGYKLQVAGNNGYIVVDPNLSLSTDRVRIGGAFSAGDGQESLLSASNNGGVSYYNAVVYRDSSLGLGTLPYPTGFGVGNPAIGIRASGNILFKSSLYLGNDGGPANSSALTFYASNLNEFTQGASYPNGQNYYYMGTVLSGPSVGFKRAPLRIAADQLLFMTGGASDVQAAVIAESGNFGIGTTTPSTQFHTTGGVRFAGLTNQDTLTRILVSDANGNLYYRTASSLADNDILRSSLAVNGTITAKELKLSREGWPDYVFDTAYRLSSLKDVENYIRHNKHLPGIPSAAEVARDGLSVGENQAVLMKKIEELTLYAIGQDKKMAAQKNELDALKLEVAELKKLISDNLSK